MGVGQTVCRSRSYLVRNTLYCLEGRFSNYFGDTVRECFWRENSFRDVSVISFSFVFVSLKEVDLLSVSASFPRSDSCSHLKTRLSTLC